MRSDLTRLRRRTLGLGCILALALVVVVPGHRATQAATADTEGPVNGHEVRAHQSGKAGSHPG